MTDIIIDVFNFIFTAILIGVFLTWLSLTHTMYQSFTKTPFLDKFEKFAEVYLIIAFVSVFISFLYNIIIRSL